MNVKLAIVLAVSGLAITGLAETKETMCVKQKDGTYRCKASGKIEKTPCCETPEPTSTPKAKRHR